MNKSLVRRLERLEARPASPDVLQRVDYEWRRTGVVPRAPIAALKLTAMFAARIAELHAYVPSSPNPDSPERQALLEYAAGLHQIEKSPTSWMGREFPLEDR